MPKDTHSSSACPQGHAPHNEPLSVPNRCFLQRPSVLACITDEASPFALRSTRNRLRRAVRRGAAWPAERPSSWLVVREAVSRWQVAHRRAVMVAKRRRRCPQEHGGVAQRRARWAWWPRRCGCRPCLRQRVGVRGQRPESSVWSGCPALRVPVHAAAVRCPVRASERPDVRCPVSGVGVRCPWVPASPVSGREVWRGGGGQAAAWLGWPASAWSPALSTASLSAARVGAWRSRLAQVCWVSGGVGLDLAVVVGGGWQWRGRPRGRPGLAGWARGSPVGGEPGCAARRRLRCVVIV
jgi:hypothetical protein